MICKDRYFRHIWYHPKGYKHLRVCLECGQTQERFIGLFWNVKIGVFNKKIERADYKVHWDTINDKEREKLRKENLEKWRAENSGTTNGS